MRMTVSFSFLPSRLFVTGFKVSLPECFLGCSFVPLCIAKIAGMVSFPGYKALFHRHKCFNRNGGVPSISFVGFVENFVAKVVAYVSYLFE